MGVSEFFGIPAVNGYLDGGDVEPVDLDPLVYSVGPGDL